MDFFDAIRTKALYDYYKPDLDARLRHIYRWYSKTFHTPLHIVEDLPLFDILQAYYEETFETMEEVERKDAVQQLMLDEEERIARERKQADDDDKFLERLRAEATKQKPKSVAEIQPAKKEPLEPLISMKFGDIPEEADSMEPGNL